MKPCKPFGHGINSHSPKLNILLKSKLPQQLDQSQSFPTGVVQKSTLIFIYLFILKLKDILKSFYELQPRLYYLSIYSKIIIFGSILTKTLGFIPLLLLQEHRDSIVVAYTWKINTPTWATGARGLKARPCINRSTNSRIKFGNNPLRLLAYVRQRDISSGSDQTKLKTGTIKTFHEDVNNAKNCIFYLL